MESFFSKNISLLLENEEIATALQKIAIPTSYKKGEIIHSSNTICNHFYLLFSGVARVFYYKDGKDVTVHIAQEQESLTAIDSFIQRKKSKYSMEALEDIECIAISRNDMEELSAKNHDFEHFGRLFLEQIYIDLAERLDSLLLHTSLERYENLLQQKPELFQRVPAKHLASFLGMSPENFSRIRGK